VLFSWKRFRNAFEARERIITYYLSLLAAGCDLTGGWEGLTHPFVLFDHVLEHYE